MFKHLIIAVLLLSIIGCNKELPLPEGGQRKIVLLGELIAGDTVVLRGGQSSPFTSSISHVLIQGLQVEVKNTDGITTGLMEREDPDASSLNTVPFSAPLVMAAGNNYQITAKHPTLGEVSALVSIPNGFSAKLNGITQVRNGNDSALQFDIDINDPKAASDYYTLEAFSESLYTTAYFRYDGNDYTVNDNQVLYDSLKHAGAAISEWVDTTHTGLINRVNIYTTDAAADNAGATAEKRYKRILLQGKSFGGTVHRTQIFVPKTYGWDASPLAQTSVYVKSVPADFYEFLKGYEQDGGSGGVGSSVPPGNVPGNVQGGLGMIGSAYRIAFSIVR